MNWTAYVAVLVWLLIIMLWAPLLDKPGAAIGWKIARRYLQPVLDPDGWCPGVAMPAHHNMTRTYGRPIRHGFRYTETARCWHCDGAWPLGPLGWRRPGQPRAVLQGGVIVRYRTGQPGVDYSNWNAAARSYAAAVAVLQRGAPGMPRCAACGLAPKSCLACTTGWLCPVCRHGNHGCAPAQCRAPEQCRRSW